MNTSNFDEFINKFDGFIDEFYEYINIFYEFINKLKFNENSVFTAELFMHFIDEIPNEFYFIYIQWKFSDEIINEIHLK